jgi:hypothetical protein
MRAPWFGRLDGEPSRSRSGPTHTLSSTSCHESVSSYELSERCFFLVSIDFGRKSFPLDPHQTISSLKPLSIYALSSEVSIPSWILMFDGCGCRKWPSCSKVLDDGHHWSFPPTDVVAIIRWAVCHPERQTELTQLSCIIC